MLEELVSVAQGLHRAGRMTFTSKGLTTIKIILRKKQTSGEEEAGLNEFQRP